MNYKRPLNKLLLVLCVMPLLLMLQPKPLTLNQQTINTLSLNQQDTYTLTISNSTPDKSLIFVTSGYTYDPMDTPTVVVSKGDKKWRCIQRDRSDLCLIQGKEFKDGDVFTVEVACDLECTYTMRAYLAEEFEAEFARSYSVNLGDQGVFVGGAVVPKGLEFTEIGVVAQFENVYEVGRALTLDVNAGQNASIPTESNSQFKGKPIWSDGTAVFLTKDDVKAGDKIKFLLSGGKGSIVTLTVISRNENVMSIRPGDEIFDDCKNGTEKIYAVSLENMTLDNDDYGVLVNLKRYSGRPVVRVSGTPSSKDPNASSLLESATYGSLTSFIISKKVRQQFNLSKTYYIIVSAVVDSAYSLVVFIDTSDYNYLFDGHSRVSQLQADEVDNYLYWSTTTASELSYTLTLEDIKGKVDFAVRVCGQSTICSTVNSSDSKYAGVPGFFHKQADKTTFTFRINTDQCSPNTEGADGKSCLIQIIVFQKDKTANVSKYLIEFAELTEQFDLIENTGFTFQQPASKSFRFALPQTGGVQQVKFYITVMSGDCELYGSSKGRSEQQYSAQELVFTDIAKSYYLSVKCTEQSYYSIVTLVKRDFNTSESYELYELPFDVPQKHMVAGKDKEVRFLVRAGKPFVVTVTPIRGVVWFEVLPSAFLKPVADSKPWIPKNNRVQIDSPGEEYLVVVHSQSEAYFSILSSLSSGCEIGIQGRPMNIKLSKNESRCLSFYINKPTDVDVMISTSGHDINLNQLKLETTVGSSAPKEQRGVSLRVPTSNFTTDCKSQEEKQNQTSCTLNLVFSTTSGEPISFNLVVEKPEDESVLFDGVIQKLSIKDGIKHVYYELIDKSSFVVFLYHNETNQTAFRIVGMLVQLDKFLHEDNLYSQNTSLLSFTTEFGYTCLTVSDDTIKASNCSECVLLMTIHGPENTTFEMEVSQSLVELSLGETRLGYAGENETKGYLISSNQKGERVLSLNAFVQGCATLQLFRFGRDVQDTDKQVAASKNGIVTIPAGPSQQYKAQLKASEDCFYHITYTETARRVFEITEGAYYDLDMKPNEEVFFVYYHQKPESFRMMGLVAYGGISFQAYSFGQLDFKDIDSILDRADKNFTFGGFSVWGSLKILSTDPKFCSLCYYLISAKSMTKTSASLVLHKLSTPIPIRNDKLLHDILDANQQIKYVYYSNRPFKLTADVTFGQLQVSVTVGNKSISNFSVTSKAILPVSERKSSEHSLFGGDNSTQFIITVKASRSTSFTLEIISKKFASQLKYGLPGHFQMTPNSSSCFEFGAQKHNKSIHLMISTSTSTDQYPLQYLITCRYSNSEIKCPTHIISNQITSHNINIELEADDATFTACFKSQIPTNITVVLSLSELKLLEEKTGLLVKSTQQVKMMMSLHAEANRQVVVDVYECRGDVQVGLHEDYMGMIKGEKTNLTYKTSRDSGHLAVEFDAPKEAQYYLYLNPYALQNGSNLALVMYTSPTTRRPESPSRDISYTINRDSIIFKAHPISSQSENTYILLVQTNQTILKAAAQCGFAGGLKNIKLVKGETEKEIVFQVPRKDIEKEVKGSTYYFVTLVGISEWEGMSHRVVYNTVEMPSLQPIIQQINRGFFGTLTTIFLVILGLMICGYIIIVKKALRRVWRYINPSGDLIQQQSNIQKTVEDKDLHPDVQLPERSQFTMSSGHGPAVASQLHAIE